MHDAEVAVTLINRHGHGKQSGDACAAVTLLREGQLGCRLVTGALSLDPEIKTVRCEFEFIEFVDGSRALRLLSESLPRVATPWVAVPPLPPSV